MASKLKSARDQIATDWEALTPPSFTNRTYRKLTGRDVLDGASGHRTFFFAPPSSAVISEFASSFSVYRYDFDARIRLSTAGAGIDGQFDDIVDEAILLVDAVNNRASWPSGVRSVSSEGYTVEDTDSDDFDLVLPITAEVEET